ncbi:MAG: LD-carboxypeptidase [Betaproteobacteria bacterium]
MDRREFATRVAALLAAAVTGTRPAAAAPHLAKPQADRGLRAAASSLLKPPVLKSRALVGLIAPGGVVDDTIIQKCVNNLESMGFAVKLSANIRAAHGGYAGTVAQRLSDLHDMFRDRDVRAIWTARGGSGCTSLLPKIDYSLVRAHPKILIGYSDITALHLALYRQARLVTFHGPVAWSSPTDYSVTQMQAVLMNPRREMVIDMSVENEKKSQAQSQFRLRTIHAGVAEGRLVGGNLSVLAALIGTPYAADFSRALLFLEEVGEAPYRVDRLLTQLEQSRPLRSAAGIMLGVFQRGDAPVGDRSLTLEEVIDSHFGEVPIPAASGFSFGHIAHQFTIPVGIRARLDTVNNTLTLLEAGVTG